MSPYGAASDLIAEITRLTDQGGEPNGSMDHKIDNLAVGIVQVVRYEGGATVADLQDRVHDALRHCESAQMHALAQELRMASRVLMAATVHRLPLPDGLTESDRTILTTLGSGPLSGRELSDETGLTPETVARRLPRLRAAGLVESYKSGRKTVNHRMPQGALAVASPRLPGAAPVPDPVLVQNDPELQRRVRKQAMNR